MRTMRHTCITLNHDAGVPRELIRAITGHELDTIDQVLKCYAAVTADQAAAALNIRLAYEARGGPRDVVRLTRATRTCDGFPRSVPSVEQRLSRQ